MNDTLSTLKMVFATALILFSAATYAQNNRLNTYENIGWYGYFGTFKLSDKWGIHTEYQWRRDRFITDWQQSLLRLGVNYQAGPGALFRAGYAWIETYPYGEIPINGLGRDFTEHRIYEMMQLSHNEGIFNISHRFMLEQRWIGRYSSAAVASEDEFPLLHRMRYMARFQIPLKGKAIKDKTPYLAWYDEIVIGFGKNVNANVFDQNRIGILLGYRFDKNVRIEGGYINQIVQFGRLVNGQNVFQHNNGIIINANFNFDLSKPQKSVTMQSPYKKLRPRHRRGASHEFDFPKLKRAFFQDEILKFPQMENLISERENKLIARSS